MMTLIPEAEFFRQDFDVDDYSLRGIRTSNSNQAKEYNKKGYGVFTTPNVFEGKNLIVNLREIRFCFFEIDDIPKSEQQEKINNSPVKPSMLIESKNSYHVYFRVKNFTEEMFKKIQCGLIDFFKSDKKLKNANRLMRVPGYLHMKDSKSPFEIKLVYKNDNVYSFEDLKNAFPYSQEIKTPIIFDCELEHVGDLTKFLQKGLSGEDQLRRMSGTPFVNYEVYTFKTVYNGKKNIIVNGKGTSCFIDEKGFIGASHGPTVWQWLTYFNHSASDIRRIINEVYGV